MRPIIRQSVVFPAYADVLYDMYLNPAIHGTITGMPVVISDQRGAEFSAFDGALKGSMLEVIKPRLIVQSWRSTNFKIDDPDSTLILSFTPEGDEGKIDLIHLDVPIQDFEGVTQGWEKYYWVPWRDYLEGKGGIAKQGRSE